MPNTREKLIEFIQAAKSRKQYDFLFGNIDDAIDMKSDDEYIADHLIANGVTIPVRCGECEHCGICYPEKQIGKEATQGWYCKEHKSYRRPDDFCSHGERKENGGL